MEPNKATTEQITFYSYWLPALAPGAYSVSVTPTLKADVAVAKETSPGKKETVTETRDLETSAVTETFHVGAPRYALTGSEAYSCYPAPGQIGRFYETLPHIVFDRCTLPWERTIWERKIDDTAPIVPPDPWLALILLTDADFSSETAVEKRRVPPIVPGTLAKLLKPDESNVIGPKIRLDPYDDKDKDLCHTIDLPARVFSAVMPRKADLPYLAHVREVKTDNKETWALLKEGKFSVVICNRFPETQVLASGEKDWGIVNTVCLVSLEGWGDYLNNPAKLDADKRCRLLVLGSWCFTCQGSSDFKYVMQERVKKNSRLLRQPALDLSEPGKRDLPASHYVNEAFRMGYSAINHDLRNGDKTISWYRGPLVPMHVLKATSYDPISCADAALLYAASTGMFDTSYAAAWQLGRLLALQDQAFAQTLYRFRNEYTRWVQSTNAAISNRIGMDKKPILERVGASEDMRDFYWSALKQADYVGGTLPSPPAKSAPKIPATVQDWLGQAMLLYGVPFQYLVPDTRMLPVESIRFFYLDAAWINCLLQGACSVGRNNEADTLADQVMRARFFEVSQKIAKALRANAKEKSESRRGDGPGAADQPEFFVDEKESEPILHWPLSGYLLRSTTVEAWIGLEAIAEGEDENKQKLKPLQILRMDRLAPDILLCIYNGKVTKIEVKQPPEAIHFGAAIKTGGGYEKTRLRKITGEANTLGDEITGSVDLPMSEKRVVQVNDLAERIKKGLKMGDGESFTSAEFAVEMIESPAMVTFTVKS